MKMCRDPEDAQDVLQDTLLAMARGVRDFRGASSISTWLYTIARSFCIKKRRRSKFAPEQSARSTRTRRRKRRGSPTRRWPGRGARRQAGRAGARAGDRARADVPRGPPPPGRRGTDRARGGRGARRERSGRQEPAPPRAAVRARARRAASRRSTAGSRAGAGDVPRRPHAVLAASRGRDQRRRSAPRWSGTSRPAAAAAAPATRSSARSPSAARRARRSRSRRRSRPRSRSPCGDFLAENA